MKKYEEMYGKKIYSIDVVFNDGSYIGTKVDELDQESEIESFVTKEEANKRLLELYDDPTVSDIDVWLTFDEYGDDCVYLNLNEGELL